MLRLKREIAVDICKKYNAYCREYDKYIVGGRKDERPHMSEWYRTRGYDVHVSSQWWWDSDNYSPKMCIDIYDTEHTIRYLHITDISSIEVRVGFLHINTSPYGKYTDAGSQIFNIVFSKNNADDIPDDDSVPEIKCPECCRDIDIRHIRNEVLEHDNKHVLYELTCTCGHKIKYQENLYIVGKVVE